MSDSPEPGTRPATPPDESAASPMERRLLGTARSWWPGWRDVACVVFLVTATFHLVMNDGGRPFRPMLPVLVLGVLAVMAAFPSFARASRWVRLLALAWALGPLIAFAFADVRAGWVRPVAAWAIAVPAAVATLHVLRRRWGPTAVTAIVGLSLSLAWYQGLLLWWGGSTSQGEKAWLSVSWHDQSGALMAMLGVGGLGVALTRSGWPRALGVAATVAGLSAAWLSGSRPTTLTALLAVCVVVAIGFRHRPRRSTAVTLTAATALTIVATIALIPVWDSLRMPDVDDATEAASPTLTNPEPSEQINGTTPVRTAPWEASLRMFASSPLTGTGPGSFAWSARPHFADDAAPTARAQNEQLQALGELGLVGGIAGLGGTLAIGWMAVVAIRRPTGSRLEGPAASTAVLLVAHAATGFDWDYPILMGLLAISAAALVSSRPLSSEDPIDTHTRATASVHQGETSQAEVGALSRIDRTLTVIAGVAAVTLTVTATTGIVLQLRGTMPWTLDGRIVAAVSAAADGDPAATAEHLDTIETWNPGAPRLQDVRELTAHGLGDLPDEELAAVIDPERSTFADQLRAAAQLLDAGQAQLTLDILDRLSPVLDQREAWGVREHVAQTTVLTLAASHDLDGCGAVESAWTDLRMWVERHGVDPSLLPWEGTEWAECDRADPGQA